MGKEIFENIVDKITLKDHVILGKMMSSPGLKYKNKVFAFYYEDKMCFKLGEPDALLEKEIRDFTLLNPFKTKGPLKGWFVVGDDHLGHWDDLATLALEKMKHQIDG